MKNWEERYQKMIESEDCMEKLISTGPEKVIFLDIDGGFKIAIVRQNQSLRKIW